MRKTDIELQQLVLRWIAHHREPLSLEKIKRVCKNISEEESASSHYRIFYPLVRRGLVEFCGENKWMLAPSVLLWKNGSPGTFILVNANEKKKKRVTGDAIYTESCTEDPFGILRFHGEMHQAKELEALLQIQVVEESSLLVLSHLPRILSVVRSFEEYNVFEKVIQQFCSKKNKWQDCQDDGRKKGLYRKDKSPASIHLLFIKNKCYKIPSLKKNPEAEWLAKWSSVILQEEPLIEWNSSSNELKVQALSLPFLVERALRMSSIHCQKGVTAEAFATTCFSHIYKAHFEELCRIFSEKVVRCVS